MFTSPERLIQGSTNLKLQLKLLLLVYLDYMTPMGKYDFVQVLTYFKSITLYLSFVDFFSYFVFLLKVK